MAEDVKKIVVLCFRSAAVDRLYEEARDSDLPAFQRLRQQGAWASLMVSSASLTACLTTLTTGASAEIHGVREEGDPCGAEYLWEAAQRSSKRTLLFAIPVERPPDPGLPSAADSPQAISSFLRTNPDWDLCFVGMGAKESMPSADREISELLQVADPETLCIVIGLPESGSRGVVILAGPRIRNGTFLKRKVTLEDVAPTLCYLGEISVPLDCTGGIIYQALEDPDMKMKELRSCRRNYDRLRRSTGPSAMC
jgi:hypothetical protein